MNIHAIPKENGLESLFYKKLKLYSSSSWDNTLSIKTVNKKFSLLFLTKQETFLVLQVLQERGLVRIKRAEVEIK